MCGNKRKNRTPTYDFGKNGDIRYMNGTGRQMLLGGTLVNFLSKSLIVNMKLRTERRNGLSHSLLNSEQP
jgi:hypothetical protein